MTVEAEELFGKINEGNTVPAFITRNLARIAEENGVPVTDAMTASDMITALRQKKVENPVSENGPPQSNSRNEQISNTRRRSAAEDAAESDESGLTGVAAKGSPVGIQGEAGIGVDQRNDPDLGEDGGQRGSASLRTQTHGPAEPVQLNEAGELTSESKKVLSRQLGVEPGQIGSVEMVSHRGAKYRTVNVLVEAENLNTSHDTQGRVRKDYPQELQPRDRSNMVYLEQQRKIAQNPDLDEDAKTGSPDNGTPIMVMLTDGDKRRNVTLIGNGRANAKQLMYADPTLVKSAESFKEGQASRAGEKGFSEMAARRMRQPVAVRVIIDPMSFDQLLEISQESNRFSGAATNSVEQAKADASRLSPAVMDMFNPQYEIGAAKNREFRDAFMLEVLGSMENITARELERRIELALFSKVYGSTQEGHAAFLRLAGERDDGIRTITQAMFSAAPDLARLQAQIAAGAAYSLDIAPDIARAAQDISEVLKNKPANQRVATALDGLLDQPGLFDDPVPPVANQILRFMVQNRRNKTRILEILQNYVNAASLTGDPRQANLFGLDAPSKESVWRLAENSVLNSGERASAEDEEAALEDVVKDFERELSKPQQERLRRVAAVQFARVEKENAEILRAHDEEGKPLPAPNGKPSKLNRRQWIQVRTPLFKRWFGDWEAASHQAFLNGPTVSKLTGNEFQKEVGKSLFDDVEDWFKTAHNSVATNPEIGNVILDRDGIKSSWGHGPGRFKAAAFAAVPDIIAKGRIIDRQNNWKNRGYDTVVLAAPIKMGSEDRLVAVVIEKRHDNRFYLHEAYLKENLQKGLSFKTGALLEPGAKSGDIERLLRNIYSVNPDSVSKVIDENGEPMVVYHGGTVGNVFSTDFSGSGGGRESAFFSTPDIRQAKDYAGTGSVKEVFINLRTPVETDVQLESDEIVQAKADGKDGYWIIEDGLVDESEIAVFSSNQIKSATDNDGSFDTDDPNTLSSGERASTKDERDSATRTRNLARAYHRLFNMQHGGVRLNEGQRSLMARAENELGQALMFHMENHRPDLHGKYQGRLFSGERVRFAGATRVVHAEAERQREGFLNDLRTAARQSGVRFYEPQARNALKKLTGALSKLNRKLAIPSDLLRGTMISQAQSPDGVRANAAKFVEKMAAMGYRLYAPDGKVDVDDSHDGSLEGYKDIALKFVKDREGYTDPVVKEVLILQPEMLKWKKRLHKEYDKERAADSRLKNDRSLPPETQQMLAKRVRHHHRVGATISRAAYLRDNPSLANRSSRSERSSSKSSINSLVSSPEMYSSQPSASQRAFTSSLISFSSLAASSASDRAFIYQDNTAKEGKWKPLSITTANIQEYRGDVEVGPLAKHKNAFGRAFDFTLGDLQTRRVQLVPIEALISNKNELEDPKFKAGQNKDPRQTAADRMVKAIEGVEGAKKRAPLDVTDNGDGTFTIQDGNATAQAAMLAGWTKIPVTVIEKSLLFSGQRKKIVDHPDLFETQNPEGNWFPDVEQPRKVRSNEKQTTTRHKRPFTGRHQEDEDWGAMGGLFDRLAGHREAKLDSGVSGGHGRFDFDAGSQDGQLGQQSRSGDGRLGGDGTVVSDVGGRDGGLGRRQGGRGDREAEDVRVDAGGTGGTNRETGSKQRVADKRIERPSKGEADRNFEITPEYRIPNG